MHSGHTTVAPRTSKCCRSAHATQLTVACLLRNTLRKSLNGRARPSPGGATAGSSRPRRTAAASISSSAIPVLEVLDARASSDPSTRPCRCQSFVLDQCVIPAAGVVAVSVGDVPVAEVCRDLLELLVEVSDGRSSQGRDHPAAVVLAAAAATVAGMTGYTAMSGWVADVPEVVVADPYRRVGALPAGRPSRSTIWRVCTDADAQALDSGTSGRLGRGMAAGTGADDRQGSAPPPLMQVRLDGKTVRGAKGNDGDQLHLLAALSGTAESGAPRGVLAQAEVTGAKTNEPATARDLLDVLDLTGVTVTADALHTVKATAELICQRGGQFVFAVKENRRALFDTLNALSWADTPIAYSSVDTGHGRITRRTIQVLPAPPDLPFPHVNQVWLIERYVTDTTGRHLSAVAQLGVASHTPHQAGPADLAGYVQGHWAIEALHWIRDTCYREDHSTVRTRSGPRILASLRNLAINALRLAGRPDITEATRWASRHMTRPFAILELTK
ncbi:ISAs1 family transposase [Micromonospora sp. CP22]|uniref:ISAs1 family transposase n=1 Tax=Micromonospora sp. CP22 TaxID=2580517 RepID=UPI0018AD1C8D|nr:ISAs1 family transposase [Micromonospora sp. CP22]